MESQLQKALAKVKQQHHEKVERVAEIKALQMISTSQVSTVMPIVLHICIIASKTPIPYSLFVIVIDIHTIFRLLLN